MDVVQELETCKASETKVSLCMLFDVVQKPRYLGFWTTSIGNMQTTMDLVVDRTL
jgi:hypothetical protein